MSLDETAIFLTDRPSRAVSLDRIATFSTGFKDGPRAVARKSQVDALPRPQPRVGGHRIGRENSDPVHVTPSAERRSSGGGGQSPARYYGTSAGVYTIGLPLHQDKAPEIAKLSHKGNGAEIIRASTDSSAARSREGGVPVARSSGVWRRPGVKKTSRLQGGRLARTMAPARSDRGARRALEEGLNAHGRGR